MRKIYAVLLTGVLFLMGSVGAGAQTTLISPTGDGGFETGATPAANNWTAVNSSTDGWYVGAVPVVSAGARCAYISSTAGAAWTYSQLSVTQHLYYDVTIPAGQSKITLSFKWKVGGEGTTTSDWDNMKVFFGLVSAMGTPVANSAISATYQISGSGAVSGMYKLSSASYNTETISFSGTPGSTYRLAFSWKADGSTTVNPPAALDEVSLVSSAPANISSTGAGGNWSATSTWAGGVVPNGGDNVTIIDGSTVTIDMSPTVGNLTVGGGATGILQYEQTTARTLTVGGNVAIAAGGTFRSNSAGTVTAHVLSAEGNITNSGTLDFSTNTNTAGAGITFTGASNQLISGTGVITDLFSLTMSKTALANLVDFNLSNFTIRGSSSSVVTTVLTSLSGTGTIKFSGSNTFSGTLWSTASYTIASTLGLWINNPNFTVQGLNGSPTITGLLRITNGTYNIGTSSGNSASGSSSTTQVTIEGGVLNVAGRLSLTSSANYTQSAGTVTVCVIGNASSTNPSFNFAGSTFTMSGGSIVIQGRNTGLTNNDYSVLPTTTAITGGTLQIGNASSTTGTWRIQGNTPNLLMFSNGSTINASITQYGSVTVNGDMTLNGTGTYTNNFNSLTIRGNSVANPGNLAINTGSIFTINSSNTQTLTFSSSFGNQTVTNLGTITTSELPSVTVNNTFLNGTVTIPTGLSLMSGSTLTLTAGTLNAGSAGAGTIGLGTATAGTFSCIRTTGALAAATASFGAGVTTKSYTYNGAATLTTGAELTTAASVTIDNLTLNNATANVTINKPVTTGTFTLTNGTLVTTSTNILSVTGTTVGSVTRAAGFVSGPMARNLPASLVSGSTYLFPVGKSAYNPFELVNATTNAGGTVTVRAEIFDASTGGTAGINMSALNTNKYWAASITAGSGNFTNTLLKLTDQTVGAIVSSSAIASSASQAGSYDLVGGSSPTVVLGTSVASVAPVATTIPGFYAIGTKAVAMSYVSSTTTQAVTTNVFTNTTNNQVIGVQVVTVGNASPLSMTSMTFNTTGTINAATDITNAKVFYTGTSSTFATTTQFGSTNATPSGSYSITGSQALLEGTNYFWLTYDIPSGATINNEVDAECTSISPGSAQTPTVTAPAGTRTIKAQLNGDYLVGPTTSAPNYLTLTAAITDLNSLGVSGPVRFLLQSNYVSTSETFPLTINAFTGASATNTLTIKPASGATLTISGSVASGAMLRLNGADYVIIDGSNTVNGTDRSLTITNSSTTAPTAVSLISLGTGAGATNNTIKNCNISTGSNVATSYGIAIGGSTPGNAGDDNDNSTIQNNLITKAYYGIYAIANSTGPNNNFLISGNTIGSSTSTSAIGFGGLTIGQADAASFIGNEVFGITNTTSFDAVIIGTGVTNSSFNTNNIHDLVNNGTNRAAGFNVGAGTTANLTFANNILYRISSNGTGGNTFGCYGFNLTAGSGYNFYYNSVYMSGDRDAITTTKPSSISAAFIVNSSSISALNIRNNIFVNTQTAATNAPKSYAIYSAAASSAFSNINYNDYFVSGTQGVLGFLTSDRTNLAGIQSGFGQNGNSITGNPQFISTTNLHISTVLTTPVESAGLTIAGITTDIDGDTRNVSTPDIGADEGTFIGPVTNDIQATAFIDPVNGGTKLTGNIAPQASFTNNGTATQTNVTVRYRILDNVLAEAYNQIATIASIAPGATINVTFPNGTINIGGAYTTKAKAELVGDAVSANDEITGTLTMLAPLAGAYTIGTGGNYATLTLAIQDLALRGVSAATSFNLTSTYNTGNETFPLTINAFTGASATNTLTIKPAFEQFITISSSVASGALIRLNGADYVIIDGSSTNTGTDRSLLIANASSTSPTAISVASLGSGAGATNNTIKNCRLGSVGTTTGFGISVGGSTPGTSGADNDNVTIQNNEISNTNIGIYANGTASLSAGGDDALLIKDNSIFFTGTTACIGIQAANATGSTISGNTISEQSSGAFAPVGISLETGFVSSSVTANILSNVLSTNSGGEGGRGITIGTGTASSALTIANNVIYGVGGISWNTFENSASMGIAIGFVGAATTSTTTAGGINLYYNSISMNGSMGAATATALSAAFYVGVNANALDIRNNIFSNTQVATSTTQKNYAIYSAAANTAFTAINKNDYFVSNSFNAGSAVLGFLGTDKTTLTAWQGATAKDGNSLNTNPNFTSATNLKIDNTNIAFIESTGDDNVGTITTDFEGDIRAPQTINSSYDPLTQATKGGGAHPDMGADEFDGQPQYDYDIAPFAFVSPLAGATLISGAGNTNLSFIPTATFKNLGTQAVADITVQYEIKDQADVSMFSSAVTGNSIAAGNTLSVDFSAVPAGILPEGTYKVILSLEVSSEPFESNTTNNVLESTLKIAGPMSGTYTIGPSGAAYPLIKDALADLALRGVSGAVFFELQSDYVSTSETFPINLNAYTGASISNTVTIRPATGATNRSISSANTTATININAGNYWIIDGRPGGAGAAKQLTISNTSTASSGTAIQFINEASNNKVQYTTLKALYPSTTSGVVNFSTTTGANGNDNNTIDNCDIDGGAAAVASPTSAAQNGIYSAGTTTTTNQNNSGNTISNCNIFNCFMPASASNGINLASGSTDWIISSNSIYQTSTRTTTTSSVYTGIIISSSGNNFTISVNYIGGNAASASGTTTITGTVASRYRGISLSVGTTTPSSIQGNTIAGWNVQSSSGATTPPGVFSGIYLTAGNALIGTVTGNTIGASTGTGSITSSCSTSGGISYGIAVDASSTVSSISNNAIGSFSTVGTTTSISHAFVGIQTTAGTTLTISGNTIGSASTANSINASTASTGSTAQRVSGIENTSSATIAITNNTIANLNSAYVPSSASSSRIMAGIVSSSGTNTITGNTVRNLTTAANATGIFSSASVIGISSTSTTAGLTISNNTISDLSNTNASASVEVDGIVYNGPSTGTNLISRNFVHSLNISSSSLSKWMTGMYLGSGLAIVQNNMIRLGILASGVSLSNDITIAGIWDNLGTSGSGYYHNSVYIGGSPSILSSAQSSAMVSTTTNIRNYQNNIFVNARSNGAGNGKHYAVNLAGTSAGLTSNYNLYQATGTGSVFGRFNAADVVSLTDWRTATGQDVNSFNSDPQFLDPTGGTPDLHLNPGITTLAEGNGADVGVTDDYDGQARSGFTPVDIGADAGNFSGLDLTGPVITYTALGNTTSTGNRTLSIAVTDVTGVPTSGIGLPVIYYRKGNSGAFTSAQATFVSGNTYSGTIDYSLLGGVITGNTIQYYVVAQDLVGTPNISANPSAGAAGFTANPPAASTPPTTPNSYLISAAFTGTYAVGTGTYTSLTNAGGIFEAINNGVVTGDINIEITANLSSETGLNALNAFASPYTIKIYPTGAARTISGALASNGLIRLNGADRVTINGSNGGGNGIDKSLTITNTGTTAPTAVSIVSLGTGAGATDNTVKNCNISTGVATTIGYGISLGGITPGTSGADNDNVTIQNNAITIAPVGIYANGTASVTTGGDDNLTISGNTIDYNGALASIGIQVGNATGSSVSQNTVSEQTSVIQAPTGISLETGFVSSTVTGNSITKSVTTNTGGYGGRGITVGTGTASSALTIANNIIYGVSGSNWSSFGTSSAMGIAIGTIGSSSTLSTTTGGINLYYNSISMTGSMGSGSATALTTALYVGSGATALDIRNNIFSNTQVATSTTQKNYAIYSAAANTAFTTINYNDYFVSNSFNAASAVPGFLTSDRTDLAGIVAGFGGNANSLNKDPRFISTTNLHLDPALGSYLESAGTPIVGITTDIDVDTRNLTTPDIGADEGNFTAIVPNDMAATAFVVPLDGGSIIQGGTVTPQATFTNTGSNNQTSVSVQFRIVGPSTLPTEVYTDTKTIASISSGANATVTFAPSSAFGSAGTYTIYAKALLALDGATGNDEKVGTFTVKSPLSGPYVVGAAPSAYTTLTAAVNDLNLLGVSAAVTFLLKDASYSTNETFPITINTFAGAGAGNTVTFKPESTVTSTISGSVASGALIKLNGSDYVTIDGSNSGGTDRSLTITNTNTTAPTAVSLISLGTGAGATNNTVKNCNISTGISAAAGYGISVGGITPGTSGADNDNVTIQNNNITVATISIYANGTASATSGGDDVLAITGNTVNSSSTIQNYGIQVGNALTSSISGNTVSVTSSGSVQPTGISLETGFVSSTVTANTITNVLATNSSGYGGRGITVGTSTATSALTIANNIIYGVNGSNWSSFGGSSSMGIAIGTIGGSSTLSTTTGGINLFYNSISMTGSIGSGSTTALTAAIYVGSGATALDIRNNIFSNTQVATSTTQKNYAIYSAAANTAFTTINYNDYFVSNSFNAASAIPGFLTSDRTNLAGIQLGFGQNTNSLTSDPLFNTTTNLQPQLGSPVVGTGVAGTGVLVDILNVTRSTGTAPSGPTMGAYETGIDGAGPVITYTALGNTTSTGNRTLSITVTDASGVPTSGAGLPVIYYRKGNTGAFASTQATYVSGSTYNCVINYTMVTGGSVATGDQIQYYVVAQDAAGTPNMSANPATGAAGFTANPPAASTPPTTPNSYLISTAFSGTYSVGSGHTYTSLTNAGGIFEAINNGVLTANLTVNITSDLSGETGTNVLNQWSEQGIGNYTLTIQPTGARTITGINTTFIKLNGADRVTIDGLNTSGNSLTLINSSTLTGSDVIWIGSLGAGAGAINNTIKNCIIQNGTTGSTSVVNFGIFVGQSSGVANGEDNDNLTIQNNVIRKATYGIQAIGGTTAGQQNDNLLIDNNTIGDAVEANSIGRIGLLVGQSTTAVISRNNILNVVTSDPSITSSNNAYGIVISTGTTGSSIIRNNITGVKYTSTAGYAGKGISINTGSSSSNITVANNFISDIKGDGWSDATSDGIAGILIAGTTGGINIYHNTVNLGSGTFAGNSSGTESGALVIASTVTGLNIRNNIFATNLVNSVASAKTYAILSKTTGNSVFTAINNNNYSSTGTQGVLGKLNSIEYSSLGTWQGVTAQDANSLNVAPNFTSSTDLHLVTSNNAALNGSGVPITGTSIDYDGQNRSLSTPDMGADEFVAVGTGSWIGGNSISWTLPDNWEANAVPAGDGTTNVTIPTTATYMPQLQGVTAVNNLSLTGPGSIVTLNGQTFTINGTISGTGSINADAAASLIIGSTNSLTFANGGNNLKNLTVNAGNTTLANQLFITGGTATSTFGTVTVASGATLASGVANLTLKSNQYGTARVASNISGSAYINGTVVVERYLPLGSTSSPRTGKSWRLLTAPVTGLISDVNVNKAWQENGTWNGGAALSPTGFGTLITGGSYANAGLANAQGFDWWLAISGATSSIRYHSGALGPVNGAWLTPANTTGLNFTNNQGYLLYVRGDRSVSSGVANATTLRATGTLKQGSFTPTLIPVLTSKFTLIGNPYASPIDFEGFINTNAPKIEERFTIFDANLGLTGGYRLVERTGNNQYSVTPSAGAPANPQYIQSSQAFFVEAKTGQSGTLSILETHKSNVVNNGVFLQDGGNSSTDMIAAKGRQAAASLNINLSIKNPDNSLLLADGAVVRISNAYNKLVTSEDAPKAYNISENLAIAVDTFRLISERRPILGKVDTIFLKLWGTAIKNYQFDITSSVLKGRTADLVDKFLGTSTPLKLDGSKNSIGFSITSNTASKNIDRFYIVTPGTGIAAIDANNTNEESVKAGAAGMKAYPNPATGRKVSVLITNLEKGNYELSAFTTTGTKMLTRKLQSTGGSLTEDITLANCGAGVYTLQLMNEEGVIVKTVSLVVSR